MSELTIREMGQDEDFAAWFSELLEQEEDPAGWTGALDEHYLILSNEIGDWVGGLRYWLRGGVAHLVDVVVLPQERHRGREHDRTTSTDERTSSPALTPGVTIDLPSEGADAPQPALFTNPCSTSCVPPHLPSRLRRGRGNCSDSLSLEGGAWVHAQSGSGGLLLRWLAPTRHSVVTRAMRRAFEHPTRVARRRSPPEASPQRRHHPPDARGSRTRWHPVDTYRFEKLLLMCADGFVEQ